jgi:hypothetical protein
MGYAIRMAVYVVGGGALLAWIEPSHGLIEIAAILALIGACAAADGLVAGTFGARKGNAPARRPKSAARRGAGARSLARGAAEPREGERRTPRPLFVSSDLEEAQALVVQLRERGLHPLLVTGRGAREDQPVSFEVRLPEPERLRAQSIVSRFTARVAER